MKGNFEHREPKSEKDNTQKQQKLGVNSLMHICNAFYELYLLKKTYMTICVAIKTNLEARWIFHPHFNFLQVNSRRQ